MRKFFIGGWGWVCRGLMSRSAKVNFLGITDLAVAIRQGSSCLSHKFLHQSPPFGTPHLPKFISPHSQSSPPTHPKFHHCHLHTFGS